MMGFEWYALLCILGVCMLLILARVAGPVLARVFFGNVEGGRK